MSIRNLYNLGARKYYWPMSIYFARVPFTEYLLGNVNDNFFCYSRLQSLKSFNQGWSNKLWNMCSASRTIYRPLSDIFSSRIVAPSSEYGFEGSSGAKGWHERFHRSQLEVGKGLHGRQLQPLLLWLIWNWCEVGAFFFGQWNASSKLTYFYKFQIKLVSEDKSVYSWWVKTNY